MREEHTETWNNEETEEPEVRQKMSCESGVQKWKHGTEKRGDDLRFV